MRTFDGTGVFVRAGDVEPGDRVRRGEQVAEVVSVSSSAGVTTLWYADQVTEQLPAETRVLRKLGEESDG